MTTLLTPLEIEELTAFAETLADAAAKVTMPYFRHPLNVIDKSVAGQKFDPVTRADQDAEMVIRQMIRKQYPDHAIIGEEHGDEAGDGAAIQDGNKLTWVIDPIDGTRAFISGLPLWGTLIALNDGTGPVIGIMDQPYIRERFIGVPGAARLADHTLLVRDCGGLAAATLSTTDPDLFPAGSEREAYDEIEKRVNLRRFGYDCYAYCMLAHGHIDLVIESGLKPFDVQALIPVVTGAGGIMTNWRGGPADQGGQVIAAGDPRVHAEALEILQPVADER